MPSNSHVHIVNKEGEIIEFSGVIALDYNFYESTFDGDNNLIQTIYKKGGSGGTLVATLDLTYDSNNNNVTRLLTIA